MLEVDVVERYLQRIRPQVKFSALQKQFLNELRNKLSVRSFDMLYNDHLAAIEEREAACAYNLKAPVLSRYADLYARLKIGTMFAVTALIGVLSSVIYQTTLYES